MRPTIVCLCGSVRFYQTFQEQCLKESLAGKIVLTIGSMQGTDDDHFGDMAPDEHQRAIAVLNALHFAKIELADEVLILNVGGYIGEHTRAELAYARLLKKHVRFLEPPKANQTLVWLDPR